MYEVELLYEQLKRQTVEQSYMNVLNTITEGAYDISEVDNSILETVKMIEEASNNKLGDLFKRFKTNRATAEKILSQHKDAALKVKPIGLEYKDFKEFVSDKEIKSLHKKAIDYINKFNPSKASEEDLKSYILAASNNVYYNEICKIFGNGEVRFNMTDVVVTKKNNKELSKADISNAIKYLQNYDKEISKIRNEEMSASTEYSNHVKSSGLITDNIKGDIEKLRNSATNHKRTEIAIADSFYYQMMIQKMSQEFNQAKHIVVKAANYNPRNLKESFDIQFYIDSMNDFNKE